MPKREDITSVMVIGSGPIVIGQACEFDYSGTQACRVLKEEGLRVILVNSNPATIMTDPEFADATYVEPITPEFVEKVIAKERPDALLATLGGQTALNAAMALDAGRRAGEVRRRADRRLHRGHRPRREPPGLQEDRRGPRRRVLAQPSSATPWTTASRAVDELGYPMVVRPSFTMGGTGSGIAYDETDLHRIAGAGLAASPTTEVLLEESILGWKEYELEVMRDTADNVVIICSIENLDPMGVHTGDSITVAPAMTLTDREYQAHARPGDRHHPLGRRRHRRLQHPVRRQPRRRPPGRHRDEPAGLAAPARWPPRPPASRSPRSRPRSRSATPSTRSPTTSPCAPTAAQHPGELRADPRLRRGQGAALRLREVPRRRPDADHPHEVGRRGDGDRAQLHRGAAEGAALPGDARTRSSTGTPGVGRPRQGRRCSRRSRTPHDGRLKQGDGRAARRRQRRGGLRGHRASTRGSSTSSLLINEVAEEVTAAPELTPALLRRAKRHGFSDDQIGKIRGMSADVVRGVRHALGIRPVYKTVDTCAAEFAAATPYHYSSYDEESEVAPRERPAVIILGSRAQPDRAGHRVRLLLRARLAGAVRGRLRDRDGQLQPRDRLHRLRHLRPALLRAAHPRGRPRGRARRAAGRPGRRASSASSAGRRRSGLAAGPRGRRACRSSAPRPRPSTSPRSAARSAGCWPRPAWSRPSTPPRRRTPRRRRSPTEIGYPVLVRPSYVLGGRGMEIVYGDDGAARPTWRSTSPPA